MPDATAVNPPPNAAAAQNPQAPQLKSLSLSVSPARAGGPDSLSLFPIAGESRLLRTA